MWMSVQLDLFVVFVSQRRIEGLQSSGLVCLLCLVFPRLSSWQLEIEKTVGSLA